MSLYREEAEVQRLSDLLTVAVRLTEPRGLTPVLSGSSSNSKNVQGQTQLLKSFVCRGFHPHAALDQTR